MKIKDLTDYYIVTSECLNGENWNNTSPDDHNVFPSANYKRSTATFSNPAYSNFPSSNTGYLIGGVTSWITKATYLSVDYYEYYYSDSTPIFARVVSGTTSNTINSGGNIITVYHPTGGLAYSSTYQITGYSSIGLLDAALATVHSSIAFDATFGDDFLDYQRSSYLFPVASSVGPHTSEKNEVKIRWGCYPGKKSSYFKVTWNIITWTIAYRAWWVEHLAGRPEPYPEPAEKPVLGPMQTAEWTGFASPNYYHYSNYTTSQFSIPVPASGYISEFINQKSYGYRSAAFGCPPKLNPFIY